LHYKYNDLQSSLAPSPAGEGWGDDCTDAGGRATHGAVAEEIKNNHLYPPGQLLLHCPTSCITHKDVGNADFAWSKNLSMQVVIPTFSLKGEGAGTYVDTYASGRGQGEGVKKAC